MSTITFNLNGKNVEALSGESIFNTAKRLGIDIPHLCHSDGLRPDGNCRACVVEVEGERTLAPSCCRSPAHGMMVSTDSPRARKSQAMVLELLLADKPAQGHLWHDNEGLQPHGELSDWATRLQVRPRAALQLSESDALQATPANVKHSPVHHAEDLSHPAMAVDLNACINCNRCVRACREEQVNNVIGVEGRGSHTRIVFDMADPMGDSRCVGCGECVQACPTGALSNKTLRGNQQVDKKVDSVCPFCGVGCLVTYHVRDNRIVKVDGRAGPANDKRLCVKGRFGFDYAHHPDRLTQPLIRKPGVSKHLDVTQHPSHWSEVFRVATWDEALDAAASQLKALRDQHGLKALAGFGSAKGSNEEAYLFQKLVR
ncbi:MAG: 4Fe-4S dicluster domain-containing protein, partial [Betaproteobacteria bacterium]|nr:4Fe-4S dicluster domain-containing protein [Betaproteobacteria bacterium]